MRSPPFQAPSSHSLRTSRSLLLCGLLWGCSSPDKEMEPPPTEPLHVEADVPPTAVAARLTVSIDPQHPALAGKTLEPVAGPATVTGSTDGLALSAWVKKVAVRPDLLWVELYFENKGPTGIKDVKVEVSDLTAAAFYDLTSDPLADATPARTLTIPRIAPQGVGRLAIGVPIADKSSMTLSVRGTASKFTSTTSSPIAVTPDGQEVWTAWPDGDVVAVLDTTSDRRVAQVQVTGRPSSAAVTPDGKFVLVTSTTANTVSVIDRQSRKVVQLFGESDGIGRDPRHVVITPDGSHAFVSAYVGDTITALGRYGDKYSVDKTLKVGRRPLGMAVSADSATLYVSHFLPRGKLSDNESWVSVLHTGELTMDHEALLRDDANLKESECLAKVFHVTADKITFEGVPTQLAGVFLSPGGDSGWIPGLKLGPVPVWEVPAGKVLPGIATATVAPAHLLLLNTRDPQRAARRLSPGVIDPADASLSYLQCSRLSMELEFNVRQFRTGIDGEQLNTGAATPTGNNPLTESGVSRFIAFSAGGRRALMLSYVADEIAVYDATTYHTASQRHFQLTGSNPVGMALTPKGDKGYVVYENSTFVSVLDMGPLGQPASLPVASYVPYEFRKIPGPPSNSVLTTLSLVRNVKSVPELPPLREVGQVPVVDRDPRSATERLGRVLFSSSSPDKYPRLSSSRQAACSSCHPFGGNDGSAWGTMEGERRTLSLYGGVAGRGWLHQSATHKDAGEFVHTVVTERLGGKGLTDDENRALTDYVAHGIPRLQSPPVDAELAQRGKAIFAIKCAGCHSGEKYTSGAPDPSDPLGGGLASGPNLFDVGTQTANLQILIPSLLTAMLPPPANELYQLIRGDRDLGASDKVQQVLGFRARPDRQAGRVKAPSLVNVWDNVLLFHNGQFQNLADAVRYLNDRLKLELGDADQRAVIEFLKTL